MRVALGIVLLGCALQTPLAFACGHCVEDKVAAVYDYSVAMQAFAQKNQVAFFGIDGSLINNDVNRREIEVSVREIAGVEKTSVRVSLESASLSMVFNPRRTSFALLQRALDKKLSPKKLSLLPLQIMDKPAQLGSESKL